MKTILLFVAIQAAFGFGASPGSCPGGWVHLQPANRCYLYDSDPVSWVQGRKKCEELADLPVILSQEADEAIRKFVRGQSGRKSQFYHLGLQRGAGPVRADNWEWVDGSPLNYTGWINPYTAAGQTAVVYNCASAFDDFVGMGVPSGAKYEGRWFSRKCDSSDAALFSATLCERRLEGKN
ncbi:C-type lectin domain family 4 member E [Aphelenchoides avenae]|nr:C-type lectin domain family 4 member E [Aphelenchus avenae]